MDRLWGALLVAIVILLVIAGMGLSWWARRRRQAGLDGAAPLPDGLGEPLLRAEGLHVATTRGGQPLERIAVGGLGFRAHAMLEVHAGGLVLALDGAADRWIPPDAVRGADRATWTIDRTVEPDGLVLLAWTLGGDDVDTYLRVDGPTALLDAIDRMTQNRTTVHDHRETA